MKRLLVLGLVILFVVIVMIICAKARAEKTELEKATDELRMITPPEVQKILDDNGWIAFRMIELVDKETRVPKMFVIQYLTIEVNDKYFRGEYMNDFEVQAELSFCIEHDTWNRFTYKIGNRVEVINLHPHQEPRGSPV